MFGTALSDDEIEDLRSASNGRIRLDIVDITDEQAVHGWAEAVNAEVQSHGLDLLINNAGILTPGPSGGPAARCDPSRVRSERLRRHHGDQRPAPQPASGPADGSSSLER